jgi:hypothetical protein
MIGNDDLPVRIVWWFVVTFVVAAAIAVWAAFG